MPPAPHVNPYDAPAAGGPPPDLQQAARRDAIWALAMAIASLLLCAPITAPFAIWKASRAMRVGPSGMATVAIVLAVLGLVTSACFWTFLIIWQYLAPETAPRP